MVGPLEYFDPLSFLVKYLVITLVVALVVALEVALVGHIHLVVALVVATWQQDHKQGQRVVGHFMVELMDYQH